MTEQTNSTANAHPQSEIFSRPHKSTTHQELFYHIKEEFGPYRGATVFFRLENNGWWGSIALCSQNDQWCRRIGRNVSRRRYFQESNYNFDEIKSHEKPAYEDAQNLYRNVANGAEFEDLEFELEE